MRKSKLGFTPVREKIRFRNRVRAGSGLLLLALALSVLAGCSARQTEPITVYLWSSELYNGYAQYVQSKLPDMEIQFVVGNSDVDFYEFYRSLEAYRKSLGDNETSLVLSPDSQFFKYFNTTLRK